jgi:predicted nucleic acid-binding Zn finger protein
MKLNWFKYNQKPSSEELLNILKRIERAYNIIELNKREQIIFEKDREQLFSVLSVKDKNRSYEVDPDIKTCTCPDFNFRLLKCKHIIAVELVSLLSSERQTSHQQSLSPSQSLASVIAA